MRFFSHQIRLFFIALQFFTRWPVPAWVGFEPAWLQQCARYFPVVGTVVGGVAALVLWVASWIWSPAVAVGLSLAASVVLTGGFHEDGWADTCDGLGGAVSREKALLIMKDSRIGSYGALGLVLMLGLKAACLIALLESDPMLALWATVWAHTASRAAPVALMHALPYAGDAEHAKAKPLATQANGATLSVALAWVLLLSGAVAWLAPREVPLLCAGWVAAGGATLAMQAWLEMRLGGYTGDNLGATQQVTELVSLLSFAALINYSG
ncbi:adenosylcobinamide-GDP ribazoletransferase [Roseateles koreensis]|uniref:Adenosylcobinamide-GDP ribazoletransferase n=1 Tax=Roseateles koreensis TaxID=2987526 RepID=A0ABT5KS73_9BURK|nr:adenosylcobinamide-GDP ribazoletransferase [Roseateles koreensis]MDC8785788.1 adenosylcobinamide-GDP ribazoletransferase [Roseateles koreensis]